MKLYTLLLLPSCILLSGTGARTLRSGDTTSNGGKLRGSQPLPLALSDDSDPSELLTFNISVFGADGNAAAKPPKLTENDIKQCLQKVEGVRGKISVCEKERGSKETELLASPPEFGPASSGLEQQARELQRKVADLQNAIDEKEEAVSKVRGEFEEAIADSLQLDIAPVRQADRDAVAQTEADLDAAAKQAAGPKTALLLAQTATLDEDAMLEALAQAAKQATAADSPAPTISLAAAPANTAAAPKAPVSSPADGGMDFTMHLPAVPTPEAPLVPLVFWQGGLALADTPALSATPAEAVPTSSIRAAWPPLSESDRLAAVEASLGSGELASSELELLAVLPPDSLAPTTGQASGGQQGDKSASGGSVQARFLRCSDELETVGLQFGACSEAVHVIDAKLGSRGLSYDEVLAGSQSTVDTLKQLQTLLDSRLRALETKYVAYWSNVRNIKGRSPNNPAPQSSAKQLLELSDYVDE